MTTDRVFADRREAGRLLGAAIEERGVLDVAETRDAIVLGLPRGGIIVAREVADVLRLPLDVLIVRKLGAPSNPEYAIGAIGSDGVRVLDAEAIRMLRIDDDALRAVESAEREELARRVDRYRASRSPLELSGRVVILVDDGIATGSTATVGARLARVRGAARIVLAVPIAPRDLRSPLTDAVDDLVVLVQPEVMGAVGRFYRRFDQTTDAEVDAALSRS